MLFDTFDLWIDAGDHSGYPMRGACALVGEERGRLELDPGSDDWRVHAERLERRETDAAFLQRLGQSLFEALFGGDNRRLGALFTAAFAAAQREGHGLRLRLRVEPPELAALPWELLYDSTREEFLATSIRRMLVRYVELPQAVPALETTLPVRLLAVLP